MTDIFLFVLVGLLFLTSVAFNLLLTNLLVNILAHGLGNNNNPEFFSHPDSPNGVNLTVNHHEGSEEDLSAGE